jgi:hypothetical protein
MQKKQVKRCVSPDSHKFLFSFYSSIGSSGKQGVLNLESPCIKNETGHNLRRDRRSQNVGGEINS